LTRACLKGVGKIPSEKERLMRIVIGLISELRHCLSNLVGIGSSEQVASEEWRMAFLTSSSVAGEKQWRRGGSKGGGMWGESCGSDVEGNEEHSLEILSSKKL
jgi:hypothetical protein